MKQIIDCFLYNDEIDLLNIRLNLLSNIVDKFVIVWSSYTFTGLRKPDPFPYELPIIKALVDRIEIIELDHIEGRGAWERETYSRNMLMKGLANTALDSIVIISDIDEIPRPESLEFLVTQGELTEPVVLLQDYFNFKFNYQLIHGRQVIWAGPVAQRMGSISSPQELRSQRWGLMIKPGKSIDHAGWHFSFLTKSDSVQPKLLHFSHQERSVQMRATANVDELISKRAGFHDHLHAGSVWAVRDVSSLECPALETLIGGHTNLIVAGQQDSEEYIREKVRWSIWALYAFELPKVIRSCAVRDLMTEFWRRLIHKLSRF